MSGEAGVDAFSTRTHDSLTPKTVMPQSIHSEFVPTFGFNITYRVNSTVEESESDELSGVAVLEDR